MRVFITTALLGIATIASAYAGEPEAPQNGIVLSASEASLIYQILIQTPTGQALLALSAAQRRAASVGGKAPPAVPPTPLGSAKKP